MKGDQRKKTTRDRQIRQLAAQIPDAAALEAIVNAVPRQKRAAFIRAIEPHLKKFQTA